MEGREEEVLFVAATRPAIMPLVGLPHSLAIVFLVAGMETIIFTKSFFSLLWLVPVWGAAFLYVRHDYNAMRILGLWLVTKFHSVDAWRWHGASLSPMPINEQTIRGIDQ
jgi:type IV secretory pathway VirB3-like protein